MRFKPSLVRALFRAPALHPSGHPSDVLFCSRKNSRPDVHLSGVPPWQSIAETNSSLM